MFGLASLPGWVEGEGKGRKGSRAAVVGRPGGELS